MEDLLRSFRARKNLGTPLPTVFEPLAEKGAHFNRGTYTLVGGAPGRGKSLFAMNLAVDSGVYVLYISPDMNESDTTLRMAAKVSGDSMYDVKQARVNDEFGFYEDIVRNTIGSRLRFTWNAPTLVDIDEEMEAFGMVYGSYPDLLIVDNIKNVYAAPEAQANLTITSDHLKRLSHDKGPATVALHHFTGEYAQGDKAPNMNAIMYQIHHDPEMILGLWGHDSTMIASILKNRDGHADPTGGYGARLTVDFERAEIK